MENWRSNIGVIAFCSVFMLIGGVAVIVGIAGIVSSGPNNLFENGFPAIWGLLFAAIPFFIMRQTIQRNAEIERMAAMDFAWYRLTHPDHVKGSRVTCFECNGMKVHVRGLMQGTFLREHFCTTCGKSLYYSREAV